MPRRNRDSVGEGLSTARISAGRKPAVQDWPHPLEHVGGSRAGFVPAGPRASGTRPAAEPLRTSSCGNAFGGRSGRPRPL